MVLNFFATFLFLTLFCFYSVMSICCMNDCCRRQVLDWCCSRKSCNMFCCNCDDRCWDDSFPDFCEHSFLRSVARTKPGGNASQLFHLVDSNNDGRLSEQETQHHLDTRFTKLGFAAMDINKICLLKKKSSMSL
uniref:EF-hand domain-containing protein n=1 Tax=Ditylenchus dipsaci TaxID=166011 RepID=A0A915DBY2_9BILA